MQEKLRRYQDDLRISGLGVLAFGIWSLLKAFLIVLLSPETSGVKEIREENGTLGVVFFLIILFVIFSFDIGLRLYVWRCTAAESAGRKKSILYIVIVIFFMLVSLAGIVFIFIFPTGLSISEMIATVFFEGSAVYMCVRLVISAYRVRVHIKKVPEEVDPCR